MRKALEMLPPKEAKEFQRRFARAAADAENLIFERNYTN
jgi:hypothetical protein